MADVSGYSELVNIIGGVLGSSTSAIATLVPTKYDKARKARIAEMEQMLKSGKLGLTEGQMNEIASLSSIGLAAQEKEFFDRQADVLRTSDTNPTAIRLSQQSAQEALRAQRSEMSRQVLAAEREAEAVQQAELAQLQLEQKARQKERIDAAASLFSLGFAGASDIASSVERNQQLLGNKGAQVNPNDMTADQQREYNMSQSTGTVRTKMAASLKAAHPEWTPDQIDAEVKRILGL